MNLTFTNDLRQRLTQARHDTDAAFVEQVLSRRLKEQSKWDRLLGDRKYSSGTYAIRLAYAEQAFRRALDAETRAEDAYMEALEAEMAEIAHEAKLLEEDLICGR